MVLVLNSFFTIPVIYPTMLVYSKRQINIVKKLPNSVKLDTRFRIEIYVIEYFYPQSRCPCFSENASIQ